MPPIDFLVSAGKSLARIPGLMASRGSDVTWLERELIPRRFMLERFAGPKRIFDVDDAIWLNGTPTENIVRHAYGVIAGNSFLADHYRLAGARVWIIPTSIDTNVWTPAVKIDDREWTIGWIGSSSNLKYLYSIEEPLADFLNDHPDSSLLIVSDRRPRFKSNTLSAFRFVRWSAAAEVQLVQRMNVGIMPLADTQWELGKCACKMLLYMAVGIPVVTSPVGVSKEILNQADVGYPAVEPNDWYDALRRLYFDRKEASVLGGNGRRLTEARYSIITNAIKLADIFRTVAVS